MSNYLKKSLICLVIFTVPCMNLAVKAMTEEDINTKLSTVKQCAHPGAQKIYCELVNADGGQKFLCSEHDASRIEELTEKLQKIKKKEAAVDTSSNKN